MELDKLVKSENGDPESLAILLEQGADLNAVDDQKRTALMLAAELGRVDNIKFLLGKDTDGNIVDTIDENGCSALQYATLNEHEEVMKIIIQARWHLSEKDHEYQWAVQGGFTKFLLLFHNALLIEAARDSDLEKVRELLAKGADVNAQDDEGSTALMCAIFHDCLDIVKELLKANINVNIQDENGRTALIWACRKRQLPAVKLIIAAGADLNIRDEAEYSAYDYSKTFHDIAAYLDQLELDKLINKKEENDLNIV